MNTHIYHNIQSDTYDIIHQVFKRKSSGCEEKLYQLDGYPNRNGKYHYSIDWYDAKRTMQQKRENKKSKCMGRFIMIDNKSRRILTW